MGRSCWLPARFPASSSRRASSGASEARSGLQTRVSSKPSPHRVGRAQRLRRLRAGPCQLRIPARAEARHRPGRVRAGRATPDRAADRSCPRRLTATGCARGCTCRLVASASISKAPTRSARRRRRASCCPRRWRPSTPSPLNWRMRSGARDCYRPGGEPGRVRTRAPPGAGTRCRSRRGWALSRACRGSPACPCRMFSHPASASSSGEDRVTDHFGPEPTAWSISRTTQAFFQGNRYLLDPLVEHVARRAGRGPVTDLYAGAGLFAVAAAAHGHAPVMAVEGDARVGGGPAPQHRRLARCWSRPATSPVEAHLQSRRTTRPQTLILDPPRTGLSGRALDGVPPWARPASSTSRAMRPRWRATCGRWSLSATSCGSSRRSTSFRTPRMSRRCRER